jgi:predicted RNA-binding protein with TRAM domain
MEDRYNKYEHLSSFREGTIMGIARFISIGLMIGLVLLIFGCEKAEDQGEGAAKTGGYGAVEVQLTDAPADYLAVNVEIKSIELHYARNDQSEGWVKLSTNAGVYDLLRLRNGVSAIIAREADFPVGRVTQARLLLGDANQISVTRTGDFQVDTVTYPLEVPGGTQTGLKLNVNAQVVAGKKLVLLIDFDADRSIVQEGNGDYKLKPVLSLKNIAYR